MIRELNKLFVEALLALKRCGREELACRLAARGWSLLRHSEPKEAERLNGAMHALTAKTKSSSPTTKRGATNE